MSTPFVRQFGIAALSAALTVTGAVVAIAGASSAQAGVGDSQLLQAPAIGTLADLGGVSGYVDQASGGDVNGWLTGQGVNPNAAAPITTVAPSGQDVVTTAVNSDGTGTVTVASTTSAVGAAGYAVGDANGALAGSIDTTSLAMAPGHESDMLRLTPDDVYAWLANSTWLVPVSGDYNGQPINETLFVQWTPGGPQVAYMDNGSDPAMMDQLVGQLKAMLASLADASTQLPISPLVPSMPAESVPVSRLTAPGSNGEDASASRTGT